VRVPLRSVAAGVFLAGLTAKLWLVARLGSPLPFWDQWDLVPFLKGDWSTLFAAHNEHRIVFTRMWTLLWVWANGGAWDCRVEMAANAVLHCATLCLLGLAVGRRLAEEERG
jgi:hypothetical protein